MFNTRLQVRARLRPSAIIGREVQLKGHGNGEFTGLCPFHQEKTPSFTVSDRKEFFHCFGCGAHGDIIDFVQKTQGYSFFEALKRLAQEAGVPLPKQEELTPARKQQETILAIFELTTQFYQCALLSKEGQVAMQYLLKRGLSPDTIADFRLGYAPSDSSTLLKTLLKNFTQEDILASTVLMLGQYGIYNQFGERVIFPICDWTGKVIAFGGRRLNEGKGPKYLNSPENPVFDKGGTLYGLHTARKDAPKSNEIVVVEGYMDVIALYNMGIKTAVAPLGTSIKAKQIEELWHIVSEPIICMDSDLAGKKAAHRLAYEILSHLKSGKSIRLMDTGQDKDPDEFIRAHGAAAFKAAMEQAVPLARYLFAEAKRNMGKDTPENRLAFKNKLLELAASVSERQLQQSYRQYLLDQFYNALRTPKQNKGHKIKHPLTIQPHIVTVMSKKDDAYIVPMFWAIATYPELLERDEVFDALLKFEFQTESLDIIRNAIVKMRDYDDRENAAHIKNVESELTHHGTQRKFSSIEEAREIVERTMKVYDLRDVQQQIAEAAAMLAHNENEEYMSRLLRLKEYEDFLKSQLNFV